ncbi:carotenoid oxygenase family protein [Vitiosangium sp. GDMCC 1.1324]|uniref:carotenoid oxygenase family protein n=1 Tax=Vitiosangium sp. (strain GDMCC 1.1324) TaxID=2138576 RepID=UPI000D38F02D|nr:carotenoid oxygenase family protein [Vitiosangium sp. GDMCC 1.1324]PTL78876.1 carotenoid oxygenase [Vitiosangium sp. GDMCC 1.1324]
MEGNVPVNPYLTRNFAPVRSEDDFELQVTGEIPEGLRGTLYRIGPNPQFDPIDPNYHWFTGDGMVHAFRFENGKVTYRNRYVRTPKWELEHAEGRSLFSGFNSTLNDPLAQGKDAGVANTHIVSHAGRLLALNESYPPFEMAHGSLDSRGYVPDYRGRVTAHPKIDPRTGEMVWFAYGVGDQPMSARVSYGVTSATGKVMRRDDFQAPYCSMMHDFLVTENYVLFPILPLTGSHERAMRGLPPIAWEPERATYVGVMRRDADVSTLRWFNTGACHVYHPMNAWEEGGKIVADVFRYDSAPLFPRADGSPGQHSMARLWRWTFDVEGTSDAIKEAAIDDLDGEFPRFDERRTGLSYRHGWYGADTAATVGEPLRLNTIAHLDNRTGQRSVFELPGGDLTSEPVFTPRSADAAEGDGWLTAVIWRAGENRSDLLVFDALDVAKGPIATAAMPRRVPFGFHGNWVPCGVHASR